MSGVQGDGRMLYAVSMQNADKKDNESHVYRHPDAVDCDIWNLKPQLKTIHDAYRVAFEKPNRQILGRRERNQDGTLQNVITWFSNKQISRWAEEFGSGLLNMGLVPEINEWNEMNLRFLGFYSINNLEYLIADIGSCMYGITTVPIYADFAEEATEHIFNQTKMSTCLITSDLVEGMMEKKSQKGCLKYLENLIVLDYDRFDKKLEEKYKHTFNIYSFDAIKGRGSNDIRKWINVSPDTLYSISYTSGTTGTPKGAMITHRNIVSIIPGAQERLNFSNEDVHVSYLPMAHVLERIFFNTYLYFNVRIVLFSGDVKNLKDDLRIIKPTLFLSVPRLYNKMYHKMQKKINNSFFWTRALINHAVKVKLENLKKNARYTHPIYDRLIFNKMREAVGGNVRALFTGSAPIDVEVMDFLRVAFSVPMLEGYGQTEGCGAQFSTVIEDGISGHVGGPLLQNEFKVVDIPDMNYTSKDRNDQGELQPRGELWCRGPNVIPGFYKLDDKNKETFTKDGWMKTGDIIMVTPPENRVQVIDRAKNIFKLSQGEYIAPEKLESAYKEAHSTFAEVFVYGDSKKSSLIAIVNIVGDDIVKLAQEFNINDSREELAQNKDLKNKIVELINNKAKKKNFSSLEMIKGILIETKDWKEMDLVTNNFKIKRKEVEKEYKERIEELYANIE